MSRKKIYKTLSPPVDYWFISSLLCALLLVFFSFLLIKERLFLQEMNVYLEKNKIDINLLSRFSLNSHLLKLTPTNLLATSTSETIYFQPPKLSYKNEF